MSMEKERTKPKYGMCSNSWYMIKKAWKNEKSILSFVIIEAALGVMMNLLGLYIGPAILKPIEAGEELTVIVQTILLFAGAMLIVGAAIEYCSANETFGEMTLRTEIIEELSQKMLTAPYPLLWNQKFQKKFQKTVEATSGNNAATEAIWATLRNLLKSVTGFIIYLLLLSTLNIGIMLLIAAAGCISYFSGKKIYNWGYAHQKEEDEYWERLDYLQDVEQRRDIAKDIRIFGMQDWLKEMYAKSYHLYNDFQARKQKRYLWANIIDIALTFLKNGAAYVYLIHMTLQNNLSAAQFLLYFSAISGFSTWMDTILNGFSRLHLQSMDISTVREYLEMEGEFDLETGEPISVEHGKLYELELSHVSFRYPGSEKEILHDINLKIKAGEKVAVVGLNGAGKTTLVKLLCGFCNPTEGRVLLNGVDIRQYKRRDYYRLFSAVFQEFSLLAATVAENVAQQMDTFDTEKFWDCIEKAGITEKIKSLPEGYHTLLCRDVFQDAVDLSGGELQRLMLARALYKDGSIIVLDEPTAALDPIAENDIYMKYGELTAGRTSVFISHRLASTRFCDRILFVADGDIAEEGTHEELLAKDGLYAELFEVQSRYYREGGAENE